MARKFKTREEWLTFVADQLRPAYKAAGWAIPVKVRFAIGFCSTGERGNRIGECWYPDASADKSVEIFIKPDQDDRMQVAGILAHELVHAAVGPGHGHKGDFRKMCGALGFTGKMTQAMPGTEMQRTVIDPILKRAGPLPHKMLQGKQTDRKKQGTRMLKAECGECGYVVRITKKWAALGLPSCGASKSHGRLTCEDADEGED